MSESYTTFTFNLTANKLRYENMDGKQYLVAPMAMLTQGVHAGSNGPLLYLEEDLKKTPVIWNMKPLVIYHPERNGQGVSACHPDIIETRGVGIVMNSYYDSKLRAEAWFDEPKLKRVDERVWNALKKGEMVEISTGLFTDNEKTGGEWNGEKYVAIARNYRPDHLAILPDRKGACSIADGAGLLQTNEANLMLNTNVESLPEADQEEALIYNDRWPQEKRDKLPAKDFAGPDQSFPIKTQKDVESAARLAHHAKDPAAVKARVKVIAKRKGLKVPEAWNDDETTNEEVIYNSRWSKANKDALPKEDFAGPNLTFPIKNQKDVNSIVKIYEKAEDAKTIRNNVIEIANRKGLKLPDGWKEEEEETNNADSDVGFSHSAIRQSIQDAIRGRVKTAHGVAGPDHVVHDVYDDFFIGQKPDGTFYSQGYEMEPQSGTYTGARADESRPMPKAKLTGNPTKVKRMFSWHDLQGNLVANQIVPDENSVREKLINELIANGFDSDEEVLQMERMNIDNLALLVQKGYADVTNGLVANTWTAAARAAAKLAEHHGYSYATTRALTKERMYHRPNGLMNRVIAIHPNGSWKHGSLGSGNDAKELKNHLESVYGKPTKNTGAMASGAVGSAGGGSATGGTPAGGSPNPADRLFAQRKPRKKPKSGQSKIPGDELAPSQPRRGINQF